MEPQVTIVVPFHAERERNGMLDTCLWSLRQQESVPGGFVVLPVLDDDGKGAAHTRQCGLEQAETPYVGFLDSDDWAYPDHVAALYFTLLSRRADYAFSYFTVHDMWEGARPDLDPLGTFGKPFDNTNPHQTTGTIMVRRAALSEHGIEFREQPPDRIIPGTELRHGEDWDLTLQCARADLTITHIAARTWAWRIGHHNTSGLPGHGDAPTATKKG